jgi:hypothetical protein
MSMTIGEANDLNTLLHWILSRQQPYCGHVLDHEATEAAKRLTTKANKTLHAGLRPDEITLSRLPVLAGMRAAQTSLEVGS